MSGHDQPYDLRWVTRRSAGVEVLCEFSTDTLKYRVLGTDVEFAITDMLSERNAIIECPCGGCSHRRGMEMRLRIAADAVRANPASPGIVADGVMITNATKSKAQNASAEHLLDSLTNHLAFIATDVRHAMAHLQIPHTSHEGPKPL